MSVLVFILSVLMIENALSAAGYATIGCYKDTSSRAMRYGPGTNGYTPATCAIACSNYYYFGVQYGGYCFCDNDLTHSTKYGPATNCANWLGGAWANDVFMNFQGNPLIQRYYSTGSYFNYPSATACIPDSRYKMVCGGGRVNQSPGSFGNLLTESYPSSNNCWTVKAKDHIYSSSATVTSYVIGIYDPSNNFDIRTKQITSSQAAHPSAQQSVYNINYDLRTMLCGGAKMVQPQHWGSMLTSSYPISTTQWQTNGKDHIQSAPSNIINYIIGIQTKKGNNFQDMFDISHVTTNNGNSGSPNSITHVLNGYTLVGGGTKLSYNSWGIMLTESFPVSNTQWQCRGKDHIQPDGSGSLVCYAIGIKSKYF